MTRWRFHSLSGAGNHGGEATMASSDATSGYAIKSRQDFPVAKTSYYGSMVRHTSALGAPQHMSRARA